jgi:hypothetical protein
MVLTRPLTASFKVQRQKKKIMKKVFLSVVVLVLLVTSVFVSCQKSDTQFKEQTNKANSVKSMSRMSSELDTFLQSVDNIGRLHNECMDTLHNYVLSLQSNNWTGSDVAIKNLLVAKMIAFYNSNGIYGGAAHVDILSDQSTLPLSLSIEAKNIVNDIYSAIDSYANGHLSHGEIIDRCIEQKNASFLLLDANEKYTIGSACAVAQYSITYWIDNATKYDNLIGGTNPPTPFSLSTEQAETAKADIAGAVYGGVSGVGGGPAGVIVGASVGAASRSFVKAFELITGIDCWFCP